MQDANELTDRQLLERTYEAIHSHTETHKEIETRLKSLETSRAYASGAVAVVAGGFAYVKGWFGFGGGH